MIPENDGYPLLGVNNKYLKKNNDKQISKITANMKNSIEH